MQMVWLFDQLATASWKSDPESRVTVGKQQQKQSFQHGHAAGYNSELSLVQVRWYAEPQMSRHHGKVYRGLRVP